MSGVAHLRQIPETAWHRAKWPWLRAVRRSERLSPMARLIACELVLDIADRNTGRCNPSPHSIADRLGCSADTVKRALSDLTKAGFIARTGGAGGRGQAAAITFLTTADVLSIQSDAPGKPAAKSTETGADLPPFKGETSADLPPFGLSKRGANLRAKGGQICRLDPERDPDTRARTREGLLGFWAGKIRDGVYIPSTAVSPDQARAMLRAGLVTEDQLRAAGVVF